MEILALIIIGIGAMMIYSESENKKRELQREQVKQELAKKHTTLISNAKNGDIPAMLELAELYETGNEPHFKKDLRYTKHWLMKAAQTGDKVAFFRIGKGFHFGNSGFNKDLPRALGFYAQSLNAGHEEARMYIDATVIQIKDEAHWAQYKRYIDLCESPPELTLLKALITVAKLKPQDTKLVGDITVIPQFQILRYRLDFLVNGTLAVEVDGQRYHNNSQAFTRDRTRDQELMLRGYSVVRFTALQVKRNPDAIARKIVKLAQRRR